MKYMPSPTMMWKLKKVIPTGGQNSRGILSSPMTVAFGVVMRQQRQHARKRHMHLHRLRCSGSGMPSTVRSPRPVVKWPSIAASFAG